MLNIFFKYNDNKLKYSLYVQEEKYVFFVAYTA